MSYLQSFPERRGAGEHEDEDFLLPEEEAALRLGVNLAVCIPPTGQYGYVVEVVEVPWGMAKTYGGWRMVESGVTRYKVLRAFRWPWLERARGADRDLIKLRQNGIDVPVKLGINASYQGVGALPVGSVLAPRPMLR